MAKAKSSGRTRIKGATAADKQQIAAARAANEADAKDNTRTGAAAPEAAPTAREARDAANKLFEKADEDGQAEIIADTQARRAIFG